MFDDYEASHEDYRQLRKDNADHPRTSHASLRLLAKVTYVCGSQYVTTNLQDCLDRLNLWRQELPAELETEDGRVGGKGPIAYCTDPDGEGDVMITDHSIYYTGELLHDRTTEQVCLSAGHEMRKHYLTYGPDRIARRYASHVRAEQFERYCEQRHNSLRWRGMEEYDAVEKANEKLREGIKRKKSTVKARPLPPMDRLRELFLCDGVVLTWKVRQGRAQQGDVVTGKQVRIDGILYTTSRVVYAMDNGDPMDSMVIDGQATKYRKAYGSVRPTEHGVEAIVQLSSDRVTVGVYSNKQQASEACRLYLRSLEMGLR